MDERQIYTVEQSTQIQSNNLKILTKGIGMQRVFHSVLLVLVFLFPWHVHASFGFSAPEIKLTLPKSIPGGNLVPLNVFADNFSDDPVTTLSLDVPSNPRGYQRAFAIKFATPQSRVFISTRIRMASHGDSNIVVTATTVSGKTSTSEMRTTVSEPVSFNDPVGLATIYQGAIKFPTTEIGQIALFKKPIRGDSDHVRVSSMIFHPMLPEIGTEKSYYVDKVMITVGGTSFADLDVTPVMSNNPFFSFDLDAKATASSPVRLEWHDTRGHSFNAVDGTLP